MPSFYVNDDSACVGDINDHCWEMYASVEEDDTSVSSDPCWSVSLTVDKCWQITSGSKCHDNPNPDIFNDIDMEPNGVFKVHAIHHANNKFYMAVEMRDPDDVELVTYLDQWGSATEVYDANGRYVYYPKYPATEILEVFGAFGGLPYEVGTNEFGFKYVIRPERDINFNVTYRMDSGFRMIKCSYITVWEEQKRKITGIDVSLAYVPSWIGDSCSLIGHEDASLSTPIVFRATDGVCYNVHPDTLEPTLTLASNVNYMLTPELGMPPESTTWHDFSLDVGATDVYPTNTEANRKYTLFDVMQNADIVVGFPFYSIVTDAMPFLQKLESFWYDEATYGVWNGNGEVGTIIEGEPYNPDIYYSRPIHYPPYLPFVGHDPDDVSIGMVTPLYNLYDGYEIPYNQRLSATMPKMNIDDDFFASTGEFILYFKSRQPAYYPDYGFFIYVVADVLGHEDYCYFSNGIYVADGTSIIKSYSTFNML